MQQSTRGVMAFTTQWALLNETEVSVAGCTGHEILNKNYKGTVTPTDVSMFDANPWRNIVVIAAEEVIPTWAHDLVKEITLDPEFAKALQAGAATCAAAKPG